METYLWIGLAIAFFLVTWFLKRPDIRANAARELLGKGALLVDVRSPSEFTSGHLEGAKNIPVHLIGQRSGELGTKDRPVILYCASGARSAMAKRTLRAAGFTRVHNLGAMRNW
ncbi:MAG: rhodanese-like domain-containing protein [Deltaproteobacteria bacterium]|nr:rhodanese-like domain-containing protein [Deltaproteobacteria bacterium]